MEQEIHQIVLTYDFVNLLSSMGLNEVVAWSTFHQDGNGGQVSKETHSITITAFLWMAAWNIIQTPT